MEKPGPAPATWSGDRRSVTDWRRKNWGEWNPRASGAQRDQLAAEGAICAAGQLGPDQNQPRLLELWAQLAGGAFQPPGPPASERYQAADGDLRLVREWQGGFAPTGELIEGRGVNASWLRQRR